MWNKINNATIKVIQYALSPITYPIHVYQMKQLDKKLEQLGIPKEQQQPISSDMMNAYC